MKFRLTAMVGFLAAVLLLSQAASAQSLYVSNRPFKQHVTLGGQMYVPLEGLLRALKADWKVNGQVVSVEYGSGQGLPITGEAVTIQFRNRTTEIKGLARDEGTWVPLREVGKALNVKVLYSEDLDTVDVIAAREITEADRQAAAEVEAERTAREQALQDAWNKRREQIQAERTPRVVAEAPPAAAPAEGEEGAPPAGGGEGTFPEEMAKAPARTEKAPAKTEKAPATSEAEEAPAKAEDAKAEEKEPEPDPEAKLIVISPSAVPDYFTGRVAITAKVQNNGYAAARNVRAVLTLKGPDGSVWDTQTVYEDDIDVDKAWTIEAAYNHVDGAAMPRGVPTVSVDLTYDKK